MATLVLTAVGTAIGGPIGGALGALLGQAVDRDILFKPKRRQGPRLTELAVQTSSYGTPIPRQYGTMRIAGSVIWSTDFVETEQEGGGGKGKPSQTSYSYSVSFAVLLSARRITGVRRIWADGKLLRGAAGDFKTATRFRLYLGDENQSPDPGMSAAIGFGATPAHRGTAYAVFEQFELADYGNRIPSLTFEVIADDAPVSPGAIAADLAVDVVDGTGAAGTLDGFSAYGDSVRGVLETLAVANGGGFAPLGAAIRFTADGAPIRTLEDRGDDTNARGGHHGVRAIAPIDTVPRTITLAHYDSARDYQTGLQRVRRPGAGVREERIEMPAVLSASAAKTMAAGALARAATARNRRTLTTGWDAADLTPGDVVTLAGEPGRWRIAGWRLKDFVLTLDLVRLAAAPIAIGADSGTGLPAPDLLNGPTIVHAVELPALDDAVLAAPRVLIAAGSAAPGWRGAALRYSIDGGTVWQSAGSVRAAATLGVVVIAPGVAPATLIDHRHTIEVTLADPSTSLSNAADALLDGGANLALVGDELLQFGRAEQIDAARWRLSRLWRGRRGTEAAIGTQAPGDRFVLLTPGTIATIEVPLAALGATVRVLAAGAGDTEAAAETEAPLTGASVRPPSPVHARAEALPGGDLQLRWVRRSRAGWRWLDGVDVPLAEEREAYRLTLAGTPERIIDANAADIVLPAAERPAVATLATITSVGTHGLSPAATMTLPAPEEE
ncbi:phage tail protein [Hephaestia sp. GCM10023244]|uniref:phage tail protein n=1 Tax=unclassified Hephaestia TaxID=2631281 RepID=UPI00207744A3|nr:phage tail protein [Hephaestia sp. MAHUQ-44]MCM8729710.1 phage tail protein [Hephaestia sp. MAHUQ-44]